MPVTEGLPVAWPLPTKTMTGEPRHKKTKKRHKEKLVNPTSTATFCRIQMLRTFEISRSKSSHFHVVFTFSVRQQRSTNQSVAAANMAIQDVFVTHGSDLSHVSHSRFIFDVFFSIHSLLCSLLFGVPLSSCNGSDTKCMWDRKKSKGGVEFLPSPEWFEYV